MIHVYMDTETGFWAARYEKYVTFGYDKYQAIGKMIFMLAANKLEFTKFPEVVEL